MRYAWAIFWTFLLVHMTVYVVSSMIGVSYDAAQGTILGLAAAILISSSLLFCLLGQQKTLINIKKQKRTSIEDVLFVIPYFAYG